MRAQPEEQPLEANLAVPLQPSCRLPRFERVLAGGVVYFPNRSITPGL